MTATDKPVWKRARLHATSGNHTAGRAMHDGASPRRPTELLAAGCFRANVAARGEGVTPRRGLRDIALDPPHEVNHYMKATCDEYRNRIVCRACMCMHARMNVCMQPHMRYCPRFHMFMYLLCTRGFTSTRVQHERNMRAMHVSRARTHKAAHGEHKLKMEQTQHNIQQTSQVHALTPQLPPRPPTPPRYYITSPHTYT